MINTRGWIAICFFCSTFFVPKAHALERIAFGGNAGTASFFTGSFDNAGTGFEFGGFLGLQVNDWLELLGSMQTSWHGGTTSGTPLTLTYPSLEFQFHPFQMGDEINFSLGLGTGYFMYTEAPTTNSSLGISVSTITDYIYADILLIGFEARYIQPFSGAFLEGGFFSALLRVGCVFDISGKKADRIIIE
jgi:hypothetical protein